jgi:hypothetical protein
LPVSLTFSAWAEVAAEETSMQVAAVPVVTCMPLEFICLLVRKP